MLYYMVNPKKLQVPEQHVFQFTVERATLSENKFKGRQGHWAYQADKKEWALLVSIYARDIPPATGKRKLTIERYGHRILDTGNFVGGCKSLVDAIKRHHEVYALDGKGGKIKVGNGLLVDDSPKWVEDIYIQHSVKMHFKERTVIVLEDL